jgi:ribosomal protein S18 acetylase RimI-like enzyme
MVIEFRKVLIPDEIPALCEFDRRIFHDYPSDLFSPETWEDLETYWMIADGEIVGCTAFLHDIDYNGRRKPGTLYIMTTGVLPEYRNRGYGRAQKEWQLQYALAHGFTAIVTNSRQSNTRMIELNRSMGFEVRCLVPHYYHEPAEAAVVMQLRLPSARKSKRPGKPHRAS